MDESPVEQAKKYVEKRKGWRPERRTVEYLVGLLVILVAATILVPRLLPGKILNYQALIGQDRGISVLNVTNATSKKLIPAPGKGEGYSAWGMSPGREEVVAAWYHEAGGKVDKVSVRSMSGFSGRTQAEWVLNVKGEDPKPSQVGFLPTHNVIWVLASGKISLVDIKSAVIFDLPLEATDESGKKEAPAAISNASFSSNDLNLAYMQGDNLEVITGFSKEPGEGTLRRRLVLQPGTTRDVSGQVVAGSVGSFTWLDDLTLMVIVDKQLEPDGAPATSVYMLKFGNDDSPAVELKVPAPGAGRFTGISSAPQGKGFALLRSSANEQAIDRYDVSGKLVKSVKLGPGVWRSPLCWSFP